MAGLRSAGTLQSSSMEDGLFGVLLTLKTVRFLVSLRGRALPPRCACAAPATPAARTAPAPRPPRRATQDEAVMRPRTAIFIMLIEVAQLLVFVLNSRFPWGSRCALPPLRRQ